MAIMQLARMSWDIPGCPSWDCIFRVRISQDVSGHSGNNKMYWT